MAEDERTDQTPAADEPTQDAPPAEEQPPAEEPAGDEPVAEQPAEESPAAAEPAEEPAAEEPAAEEPAAEEPAEAEAPASEAAPPAAAPKAKDQPPGAELEPIAIEPEPELSAEERARLEAEAEERARLEAEAEAGEEPVARSGPRVEIPSGARIQATGKRKSSIARVILQPGDGAFAVNGQGARRVLPAPEPAHSRPPAAASPPATRARSDVQVRVQGGGVSGQAGAVRHGVARALCEIDPELRAELKRRGLLTRDARKKERRKAGLKKARKRPQFSKR